MDPQPSRQILPSQELRGGQVQYRLQLQNHPDGPNNPTKMCQTVQSMQIPSILQLFIVSDILNTFMDEMAIFIRYSDYCTQFATLL